MKLDIVISANGENTLRALSKIYHNHYKEICKYKIYIYDSKYSEEMRQELKEIGVENYREINHNAIIKNRKHIEHIRKQEEKPDVVLRATADDIFLYSEDDLKELKEDQWKYVRQKDVLNFEAFKVKNNKIGLRGQIMNNDSIIDRESQNIESIDDASRNMEVNYYGLFSRSMYVATVNWQIGILNYFPEEWLHLTEVLLGFPFRGCKGFWSNNALYINQRSPIRNWGNQLPGRGIARQMKEFRKPISLLPLYNRFIDTMRKEPLLEGEIPSIEEVWMDDMRDLRISKVVNDIHRCGSAFQRLGYYAFEIVCEDIYNKENSVRVGTDPNNKCNLKIACSLNQEFIDFCSICISHQ